VTTLRSTNPATGESWDVCEAMGHAQFTEAIDLAHLAHLEWSRVPLKTRAAAIARLGSVLEGKTDEYARLMAREMGKPVREGRSEIEKCARLCAYYAEHAEAHLAPETIETGASRSYVTYEPLGLVFAIMPWNFPFWQVMRCAVPSVAAGNGVLLKHAENVVGCALAIEEVFREADFPEHLFRTLPIVRDHAASVIRNPRVQAVSLTGSTRAGKAVAQEAGSSLKKLVLELGGSDPYVVLEDAPLEETVATCVKSRLVNSGQSCIAAKRFIVVESVREEFERRFVERMRAAKVGDPLDDDTDLGPMARTDLRDDLHRQVQKSVEAGARCLLGGEPPPGPGSYYPPTVLTDVAPGMPAYDEELFGPVASILGAEDEENAIRIANDTPFGLGAAVFTADVERGEAIARDRLQAGCCFVNDFVRSDPRLPFGGIKESGYGRELSRHGIHEFVNVKTVYVA